MHPPHHIRKRGCLGILFFFFRMFNFQGTVNGPLTIGRYYSGHSFSLWLPLVSFLFNPMKTPIFPGAEAIGFLEQFCKVAGIVIPDFSRNRSNSIIGVF